MDLRIILAYTFNGALVAICGFALLKGGRPERIGAISNLAGSILTDAARLAFPAAWTPAHYLITMIDLAVLATFLWLATRSTRFWPIWAFGFALAAVVMSAAGALLPKTPLFAFHTGLGIYAYLALAALAIGTYQLPRDATPDQRRGHRPPWKAPTTT